MGLQPIGAIFILVLVLGPFVACWYAALRGLLQRAAGIRTLDAAEAHNWSLLGSVIALLLVLIAAWCGIGLFASNLGLIGITCAVALVPAFRRQPDPAGYDARTKRAFLRYLLFTATIGIVAGYLAGQLLAGTLVDD